ncbi:MAG: c-type cytochrome [Bdellovibrionaceae bacterium]|nr:c-type cytochrome [Pseudobdellovibrionaceae bacterium]
MSENDKNVEGQIIEGHVYDGIKELDNPLPKWWLFTFYITIVFSIFYYGYYELFGGPTSHEILAADMAKVEALQQQNAQDAPEEQPIDMNDVNSILADASVMAEAKRQYDGKCAACHGMNGEGTVGPNLTDKYWIHSKGELDAIVVALKKGFPDKGMPPWEDMIPKEYHLAVAVYIKQMPPASGRPPQGDLVEE